MLLRPTTWFQPYRAGAQPRPPAPPSPPLLTITPASGPTLTIRAV